MCPQAERLRAKAQRPEGARSMQQACRYLYYLGRIRAVQLEYSEAKDCLQQAARKVRRRLHAMCTLCFRQQTLDATALFAAALRWCI
jgi:hypothetical protein